MFVNRVEAASGQQVVFYVMDKFDHLHGVTQAFTRSRWERSLFNRPATDA